MLLQEVNFRWNDAFYPWLRSPLNFHLGIRRPDMVGFPAATTKVLQLKLNLPKRKLLNMLNCHIAP